MKAAQQKFLREQAQRRTKPGPRIARVEQPAKAAKPPPAGKPAGKPSPDTGAGKGKGA